MKRKRLVVLNTFKPLKKIIKFACNCYFTSISTESDSSSSFSSTSAFKWTSEVTCNKARYNELREETFFFHFSEKDLVYFSKNSTESDLHR